MFGPDWHSDHHVTRNILDDYPEQAKTGIQLGHLQTATGFGAGKEFMGKLMLFSSNLLTDWDLLTVRSSQNLVASDVGVTSYS